MSNLLPILASYVPPDVVRWAMHQGVGNPTPAKAEKHQSRPLPAAVLFADVSGFTPLTEALAQKGPEGAEELTRLLNTYFSRMIFLIEAEGGEVVKFSGDAVTVVFPAPGGLPDLGYSTRRAMQAAQAMQAAMSEFASLETSVGPVALGMKIGIAAGVILAAQIGGERDRWEYVIAGDPLRQVAQAEHQAERGDIILSPEAQAIIAPTAVPPHAFSQPDWSALDDPGPVETLLRYFVPGAVMTWLEGELQEWLAVLRPMSVLFINVEGLDYDHPKVIDRLQGFFRSAQATLYRYEGSINKLAVDDKGTVLIALFGAPPYAHEDDPERALRCAMDLLDLAEDQDLELAIGVTTGRVFAGPVGSQTRREYTVMGDTVNLAARLMALAGAGQIRCDYETYRAARKELAFDILPAVPIKGKAGLIRVYRPTGELDPDAQAEFRSQFVGRAAELERLKGLLDDLLTDSLATHCLVIEGEAGIGKSRLVEEIVRLARERGLAGLIGMGQSIERQTPYRAWRDIFTTYFYLEELDDPAERRQRVAEQVADLVPEMAERLPLLNDVLNLGFPENDLTVSLDSHLRHESLVSLLLALLRTWANERPLVLLLEDAHWLDSLSWDLVIQTVRTLSIARVTAGVVVIMRPMEGEAARIEPVTLVNMAETEVMQLAALSPEETLALAATRLGLPPAGLPEAVARLVRTRAGGNPFFAEELIYALRDNELLAVEQLGGEPQCVVKGDLDALAHTLPDTIQGIVLSRIDRLVPEAQLTLKVAAVIGRTFAYLTLRDTLIRQADIGERLLQLYLDDLVHLDLTPLEVPEPELTYIFKHIITQEVAYETLLFAQRRQLHRSVAEWFETRFGGETPASGSDSPLAPYYPLLVYHWGRAEVVEKERTYARLAGELAAAQFANVEAAGYFTRALTLTPETDLAGRYELVLAREAVNDLRGDREAQSEDLIALTLLAEAMEDQTRQAGAALRLANYLEVTSDYAGALMSVQRVIEQSTLARDEVIEVEGYITWGKVLWRQGKYEAARRPLSYALELSRRTGNGHGEAKSLYYLGHASLYQGDYPAAQDYYRQALEIYRANQHRQGEADSLSILGVTHYELGDYAPAREYDDHALTIYRTIGDRQGETIVLGNLGTIYCDLGNYEAAREYHRRAYDLRLTIGDRWGAGTSLTNLGLVNHKLGRNDLARQHCEQALTIQREIGDRHSESYSLTYLGHALSALETWEAAAATYRQAADLRRELGQQSLVIDDLAGLARVALGEGKLAEAQEQVALILAWLDENGAEGIEYPLQVYLTCYQVLDAVGETAPNGRPAAAEVLVIAFNALMERANSIGDSESRRKFLQNVETNREILTLHETLVART